MTAWTDLFFELMYSDVGGHPASPEYRYIVTQVAHFGLGAFFGACPRRYGVGFLSLMMVKELLADIPSDGFAPLTMLDSMADITCIAAGLLLMRWTTRRMLAKRA